MIHNTFHRIVPRLLAGAEAIGSWLERHRIRTYAAQAAFFLTVSALPMLLVLLSSFRLLAPGAGCDRLRRLASDLPVELSPLMETALTEAEAKADPRMLPAGALLLLWSASRGIRSIGAGMRSVCGTEGKQGPVRYVLRSLFYTCVYLLIALLVPGLPLFGEVLLSGRIGNCSAVLSRLLNGAAVFFLLTALFWLAFRGLAGRRERLKALWPGAVFAAAGWLLYSHIYLLYLRYLADDSFLSGTISALVAVMLWLYACMEILLIGAGIAARGGRSRGTKSQ